MGYKESQDFGEISDSTLEFSLFPIKISYILYQPLFSIRTETKDLHRI